MLSSQIIKSMFIESYEIIQNKVDYLNAINVFPVPDADTGVNIEITIRQIVESIKKLEKETPDFNIKQICDTISEGAFKGAKGNSGVILSQYFEGFTNVIRDAEELTPQVFSNALLEGSKFAYEAVLNPKEGTILTVARKVAESSVKFTSNGVSWSQTLKNAFSTSQIATQETTEELMDLKSSGVVDSGALALVYIIEGWHNVVVSEAGTLDIDDILLIEMEKLHNEVNIEKTEAKMENRYCTEGFIAEVQSELNSVRKELLDEGDSFMLIDLGDKPDYQMKLHIHTNNPLKVINRFSQHGKLISVKIDDMWQQVKDAHE